MSYVVLSVFLTHAFWVRTGVQGAVMLTSEPADTYVMKGDSAYFNCSYTGTSDLPLWIINDIYYIIGSYPPRHEYYSLNQFLELYNTQLTDNGTTYRCRVVNKLSRTATLFVHKFVSTSSEGISTESTTFHTQSEPMILFSSNADKANSSEALYCCNNNSPDNYTWIVTGAIAVGLMGVLVLAVVMIIIKKSKKDKKIDENTEPYYEQIPAQKVYEQTSEEIPGTVQNVAYGQLQMSESVQMNENACYDYCGVLNETNNVLQPNDTPNYTEGVGGESNYM